jgi:hypothetical protein
MNLFVTKLTAGHCILLEQWMQLELLASELCDEGEKWLVAVYHFAGSQAGSPGQWKISVYLDTEDITFSTTLHYPLQGFDPATALDAIKIAFCVHQNKQRLARNKAATKRMIDRCAAEIERQVA